MNCNDIANDYKAEADQRADDAERERGEGHDGKLLFNPLCVMF